MTDTITESPRYAMERCCLSAILHNPERALPSVRAILGDDSAHFEEERNRAIYEYMQKTDVIDSVCLYTDLSLQFGGEFGGFVSYIARISEACTTSSNAEFYAKRVLEESRKRYIQKAALKVKEGELSYTEAAEGEKAFLTKENSIINGKQLADLTEDHLNDIAAMQGRPQGIPTGMPILNEKVHGWRYGKYILIGARTSVGKTALAINAAVSAAQGGFPVLMFSCEMDATDIGERAFQILGNVDVEHVRRGWNLHIQKPRIKQAAESLRKIQKIHIDDDQKLSLAKIRDRSHLFVKQHGCSLIIIDYLQRVRPDGKKADKRNEVASISAEIQTLAKELKSPIICLAQVNRQGLNTQNSSAETTATIQESDSPAQDADLMIFLIKPEGKTLDSLAEENNIPFADKENLLQILISKNRMGPTGKTLCIFDKRFQTFRTIGQSAPDWGNFEKDEIIPKIADSTYTQQNFLEEQNPT
mgnify:CR=1 FL=1